jgi:hypothetical protein
LRLAGGARAGEVPPAQASSLVLFGAAGIAWEALHPTSWLALGPRADLMLLRHELSHLDADDPSTVREGLWQIGADTLLEASWTLSPNAGFFLSAGAEYAFGEGRIYLGDAKIASVPVLRLVSEFGARARF